MRLVFFRWLYFGVAAHAHRARLPRVLRRLPGLRYAPEIRAQLVSAARRPRRLCGWFPVRGRSWAAVRCHGGCSPRPSRRLCTRVTCRRARGSGRDGPRDDHSRYPVLGGPRAPASAADSDCPDRFGMLPQMAVKLRPLPSGDAHEFGNFRSFFRRCA